VCSTREQLEVQQASEVATILQHPAAAAAAAAAARIATGKGSAASNRGIEGSGKGGMREKGKGERRVVR